jgi:hypothetical protein
VLQGLQLQLQVGARRLRVLQLTPQPLHLRAELATHLSPPMPNKELKNNTTLKQKTENENDNNAKNDEYDNNNDTQYCTGKNNTCLTNIIRADRELILLV